MDNKTLFKKYYSKLVLEGIIKALIFGFIAGLASSIIPAFVMLLMRNNGLWLSAGIGLAVVLISTPIFYFALFRPETKRIAERLDRLGLEERLITMIELQKDERYIAQRQRDDAREKLLANRKPIKLFISKIPVVLFAALFVFSISLIALSVVLASEPAKEIIAEEPQAPENDPLYIRVSYLADIGGCIAGNAKQFVIKGEETTRVVAVADEGYAFEAWSDGRRTAERFDGNITEETVFVAIFIRLLEAPTEEGDAPGPPGDKDENPTAGGKYLPSNQIINGEKYYREFYQHYYDQAMKIITEGGQISPQLRAVVEMYFGIIL